MRINPFAAGIVLLSLLLVGCQAVKLASQIGTAVGGDQ